MYLINPTAKTNHSISNVDTDHMKMRLQTPVKTPLSTFKCDLFNLYISIKNKLIYFRSTLS